MLPVLIAAFVPRALIQSLLDSGRRWWFARHPCHANGLVTDLEGVSIQQAPSI